MRIQQQLHSSPWNIRAISELPIVLKSSGTENRPRRNPSLRTCFPVGVSRAVTLTIGLPALAMINGFPPAASSTKRDSCVLALWMLTVITKPPIELSLVSLVQHGLSVKNLVLLSVKSGRTPCASPLSHASSYFRWTRFIFAMSAADKLSRATPIPGQINIGQINDNTLRTLTEPPRKHLLL